MKKPTIPTYIKTKVILDFDTEEQANAFFTLFANPIGENYQGLSLLATYLPEKIKVKAIGQTKELKHNYLVKVV